MRRTLTLVLLVAVSGCSSEPAEPFHGTWRVTAVAAPGVSAAAPAVAARQVGVEASFAPGRAQFGDRTCEGATYTRRVMAAATFTEAYRVTPQQLSLGGDQVAMVDILCTSGALDAGSSLILRNDGSMLTLWDGAFYELRR